MIYYYFISNKIIFVKIKKIGYKRISLFYFIKLIFLLINKFWIDSKSIFTKIDFISINLQYKNKKN